MSLCDSVHADILQGSPYITNYTSKEIQGGPQIWCWVQDKRGMVYVGDMEGVIEFDGRQWKRIRNSNNSIVRKMAVDSLGRVYVGASDDFGFLQPNNKGEMSYVSISKSVSDKGIKFLDIWGVFTTSHGVYYCSNKYIFRYFEKKISIIAVDFLVQDAYVLNDQLYLPTQNGLCLLKNTTLFPVSSQICFRLTHWRGNDFFALNGSRGLCVFNTKTLQIDEIKTSGKVFFENNPINDLKLIDNKKLVVTTKTNKIVILSVNGDIIQVIDKNNGFSSGSIYEIQVDNDKNLWICTSKGISKIDINFPALKFGEKNNINSNVIESYLFNKKRYIATIDGIYYLPPFDIIKSEDSQKFIKIKPIEDESWEFMEMNQQLYALCSKGVWVVNNNTAKLIYEIAVPQKAHCFNTSPLFPNIIFVGMRGKLLALKLNGNKNINKIAVIDEMNIPEITEKIRRITFDKNGNLWLNTQFDGIYFLRFLDGNIKNYRVTLLGENNGLYNLCGTKTYKVNNEITIATGSGLLQPRFPRGRNKADSLIRFEHCMLFGDTIKDSYPIVAHVTENKYLIAGNGVYSATYGGTKQTFDTCGFNRLSFVVESLSVGEDSLISFCSPDGLYYYDIKNRRNFKKPFNAIISKVEVGNDSVLFDGSFHKWVGSTKIASLIQNPELVHELDFHYNSLIFFYSGLFFEDPEETQFQHQLIGFDKEWSDWSTENKSNYTNLPEGKYTFKVRAKNVYGVISDIAEYKFLISPPWYRSWWSYILYFIFFITIIYTSIKLYSRRLQKQKASLEIIVEERTSEIIKQTKELKITNERLVEMDKFKQDITSMIVHDLKNPINLIINNTDSDPANQLMRIKQTGKQMLNSVMNILDVNKYEETKILLNIEKVCLFDISKKAIESVLFLSKEKNINILNCVKKNIFVKADAEMIERVFMNILTNAIKYTPNNGRIIIDTELMNEQQTGSCVKVSITDNGIGIAAEKLNLIFEKFGQVIAKNSGSARSTGLGLTYCKMVIEAHAGEINVDSEQNKGCTFWFTLPMIKSDENTIIDPELTDFFDTETKELSLTSQQLIREYLLKLQNTEIYKISELNVIIEKIDGSNDEIREWKKNLIRAIDAGNEYLYKKLLFIGIDDDSL